MWIDVYLVGRIEGGDAQLLPWLDGLPFHVAANVCEMVGAVRIHGRTPNLNTLTEGRWCDAGEAGFGVFPNDLTRSAVSIDDPGPGRVDIPMAAKAANRGAAELIRLILDQRLAWVGAAQGRSGYLSVLVAVSEVRRMTRDEELSGMPWTDLTRALSVSDRTAKTLVQTGILKITTARHPVNRCPFDVVSYEDVEAFRAESVTLFAIARQTRVYFRKLKATLESRGVLPCFPRDVVMATIYRRVDVMPVIATIGETERVQP